jgi:hypothetical protein
MFRIPQTGYKQLVYQLLRGGAAMETSNDIYTYQDQTIGDADLIGYSVEATDGSIGKIDDATNEVGGSYVVVDTGPWIFGKHVLLPAGVVQRIDHDDKTVYVNRTKDEIKNSPEWDDERKVDESYRSEVGTYYSTRD